MFVLYHYFNIIYQFCQGVVLNWINSYALDKDEAIRDVLQLFVDLASYQHINLNTFLEHHEITEIVPHMENSLNSIISVCILFCISSFYFIY